MAASPKNSIGLSETYETIKARCLEAGILYEDPDFPGFDSKYFLDSQCNHIWKRPQQILGDSGIPEFFSAGTNRFDIVQGEIGDCWLQSSIATICERQGLFERIVPPGQDFKKGSYAGIFRFNFWWFGKWTEVLIDDRLATCHGELAFVKSSERSEFWSALFEKAYAKLNGGYLNIDGSFASRAFEDLTGGLCEAFMLPLTSCSPSEFWKNLLKADENGSLMSATTTVPGGGPLEKFVLENGLMTCHVYSITKVKEVTLKADEEQTRALIRLRDPYGGAHEWTGAWGDSSEEWSSISEEEKQSIGLVKESDGEFWMSYDDFLESFWRIDVCNLGPDSISTESSTTNRKCWKAAQHQGSWIRGINAGGSANQLCENPQFKFSIYETDDDDDDDDNDHTVIIALMQKKRLKMEKSDYNIGVFVYKLKNGQQHKDLKKDFFVNHDPVYRSDFDDNSRQLVVRLNLPKGLYCILPATLNSDEEADFILRIFTEKPIEVHS